MGLRTAARLAAALAIVAIVVFVAPVRDRLLVSVGELLATADQPAPADTAVITPESGAAGDIEAGDLYAKGLVKSVVVLVPAPLPIDLELARRGVRLPNFTLDTLEQLGIPETAIRTLEAGEGGTTENTAALSAWAGPRTGERFLVIVGPTHARRYRRAILRVWPPGHPRPLVIATPYSAFRPATWWQSRTTLRDGLMELEKLVLDYVQHPFG